MNGFTGSLYVGSALLAGGWARDVRLRIDAGGRIATIHSGVQPAPGDVRLTGRVLLPAPANLHSHAFQRAMAGLTENRAAAGDGFWAWRRLMYRFLARLQPEDVEVIAGLVQMEMLEAGYASCGEFHYLHNAADGTPYADRAEMGRRIVAAAARTGIGLTLMPVFYRRGGFDNRPLEGGQKRFASDREGYGRLVEASEAALAALPPDSRLGVAPHSLRAVGADDLAWVTAIRPQAPLHIHIAEQTAEVAAARAACGAPPVAWLLDNLPVNDRWCAVHATHMTGAEMSALARSGAVVGLCPITECNLGDGIFPAPAFRAAGGRFGVGSDSNVRISLTGELRLLEYTQRLRDRTRAVLAAPAGSVGRCLLESAAAGGARALGRAAGAIRPGALADLLTLDRNDRHLQGLDGDRLLDAWIFAGDDRAVRDVFSAGRHLVQDGRHRDRQAILAAFSRLAPRLRALA